MPIARRRQTIPSPLKLAPLVLAWALSPTAYAQSLADLVVSARGYDATYLGALAQAKAVDERLTQAKSVNLPQAQLSGNITSSQISTPVGAPVYAVPTNRSVDQTNKEATLTAKQALFNRPNDATVDQARKGIEAARADLDAAEQDLMVRVAQAYFDVLAARDTLATAQAAKAAISEQLASAKRRFDVGTATITDTREAQARFDLSTAQEIAADNDLRTKRIALDQLVGQSNVAPKPLLTPVSLPNVAPADAEAWVATADAQNPLVRKARIGLEVAKLDIDKARAGNLPTLDLVARYDANHANGSALVAPAAPGTTRTSSLGLQFNVPLFTGYAIQGAVKEKIALEDKARDDLESARRAASLGTRQAYLGLQAGLAQVKALEAAESSTQLALEATQTGYKVGVRVNLDVLNAQTQLFSTQTDLAKARYAVIVGNLKLRQASGQLKAEDVQEISTKLLAP